jgi:hypothetical protein
MITTNTGAKKIEGTDNWRQIFDAHNDSVDAHDKISDAMTYVVNGNKSIESVSIPVGHYFRLANSSIAGRSDGLYTAKIAIPVDTVIDATYFNEAAPITGGIAEALNSKITNLHFVRSGSSIEKHTTGTVSVPCDGIVAVTARATANGELLMRASTEFGEIIINANALAGVYSQVSLPCKKNDTITITNVTNVSTCYFAFYAFAY